MKLLAGAIWTWPDNRDWHRGGNVVRWRHVWALVKAEQVSHGGDWAQDMEASTHL